MDNARSSLSRSFALHVEGRAPRGLRGVASGTHGFEFDLGKYEYGSWMNLRYFGALK